MGHSPYTVIDVGGSGRLWTLPILGNGSAVVDRRDPRTNHDIGISVHFFSARLDDSNEWEDLYKYVEKHGKFNFSVCSNTLEDVSANPIQLVRLLTRISRRGIISVPTKYAE